jgi:hypothetical protein
LIEKLVRRFSLGRSLGGISLTPRLLRSFHRAIERITRFELAECHGATQKKQKRSRHTV